MIYFVLPTKENIERELTVLIVKPAAMANRTVVILSEKDSENHDTRLFP